MRRDALRRRAIVAQNRLFFYSERRRTTCRSRRRCHAKFYRRAGKFWHDVVLRRGALWRLASYCELGFTRVVASEGKNSRPRQICHLDRASTRSCPSIHRSCVPSDCYRDNQQAERFRMFWWGVIKPRTEWGTEQHRKITGGVLVYSDHLPRHWNLIQQPRSSLLHLLQLPGSVKLLVEYHDCLPLVSDNVDSLSRLYVYSNCLSLCELSTSVTEYDNPIVSGNLRAKPPSLVDWTVWTLGSLEMKPQFRVPDDDP